MYNNIILRNRFIRYRIECHKRFDLSLLDIGYSSDEMVKTRSYKASLPILIAHWLFFWDG